MSTIYDLIDELERGERHFVGHPLPPNHFPERCAIRNDSELARLLKNNDETTIESNQG